MPDPSPRIHLSFDAVLFDMDGVVTRTATLHAAAWKELFDEFLRAHVAAGHAAFRPFDPEGDYLAYVDGRPREDGVRTFLAARGVQIADGASTREGGPATVYGLSARKDELFLQRMRTVGVGVFGSTVALIRALREHGVKTAVVTSSKNGREVLRAAGVEDLFDVGVDGIDAATLDLLRRSTEVTLFCSREMVHPVVGAVRAATGAMLAGVPLASLHDLSSMVPS